MTNIAIGGEIITASDAMKLVDSLYEHAYQLAGKFYENNRSEKFRLNWPNAYDFAEANRRTFIEQARKDFSAILGDAKADEKAKKRAYLAIMCERAFAEGLKAMGHEADTRLQIHTDSQQFVGDKDENRKIMEKFGRTQNLRAGLMNSVARIARETRTVH